MGTDTEAMEKEKVHYTAPGMPGMPGPPSETEVIEIEKEQNEAPEADVEIHGGCPECKGPGRFYNVLNQSFLICDNCKTFWHSGRDDTESWRNEDYGVWANNAEKLHECKEVEPYRPEPQKPERKQVENKLHWGNEALVFKCECIEKDCEWFVHDKCRIWSGMKQIRSEFFDVVSKFTPELPACEISYYKAESGSPEDNIPF